MILHHAKRFRRQWRTATVVVAFIAANLQGAVATATTVTYSDDTFVDANWSATKIIDTTSGASATFEAIQVTAGGNPGDYRKVTHTFDAGTIFVGHLRTAAVYDPSVTGAIQSIAYSYDLIHLDPPEGQAVAYGIALFQNDSWYTAALNAIFLEDWTSFGLSGLAAGNFGRRAGAGPSNPDFSATGAAMIFGYVSANNNSGGADDLVRISGIDNWQVEVTTVAGTTVPLPAGAWLLLSGSGLIALLGFARRNRAS